jgi:hypothetical protein
MSFSALKLLGVSNHALGDLAIVGGALTVGTVVTLLVRGKRNTPAEPDVELATTG